MYVYLRNSITLPIHTVIGILTRERSGTCQIHIDNIMAAGDFMTQGARASKAMILT